MQHTDGRLQSRPGVDRPRWRAEHLLPPGMRIDKQRRQGGKRQRGEIGTRSSTERKVSGIRFTRELVQDMGDRGGMRGRTCGLRGERARGLRASPEGARSEREGRGAIRVRSVGGPWAVRVRILRIVTGSHPALTLYPIRPSPDTPVGLE